MKPKPPLPMLLDDWLKQSGLTDEEFARRIGCHAVSVGRLRRLEQWPKRALARAIRLATGGQVTAASFDDPGRLKEKESTKARRTSSALKRRAA